MKPNPLSWTTFALTFSCVLCFLSRAGADRAGNDTTDEKAYRSNLDSEESCRRAHRAEKCCAEANYDASTELEIVHIAEFLLIRTESDSERDLVVETDALPVDAAPSRQ